MTRRCSGCGAIHHRRRPAITRRFHAVLRRAIEKADRTHQEHLDSLRPRAQKARGKLRGLRRR